MVDQAKQAIIWGGNYFRLPETRCVLVWDKQNDNRDFADLEMAWTNIDAVARIFRMRPQGMDGGKVHPTQKPIRLMKWCIAKLDAQQTIVDAFGGSGSTAVAPTTQGQDATRAEEHTSELESLWRIWYAAVGLKTKIKT